MHSRYGTIVGSYWAEKGGSARRPRGTALQIPPRAVWKRRRMALQDASGRPPISSSMRSCHFSTSSQSPASSAFCTCPITLMRGVSSAILSTCQHSVPPETEPRSFQETETDPLLCFRVSPDELITTSGGAHVFILCKEPQGRESFRSSVCEKRIL